MDNAPCISHYVPGTEVRNTNSNRHVISTWLDRSNIDNPENAVKANVRGDESEQAHPKYIIGEIALQYDHKGFRLLPRHRELNPIEMVWTDLKGYVYVARNNSSYKKGGCY